ncbi:MAG: tRNA adenosine(34) deaminase TadA [Myxococcales bacterium]|nr:tRNA adenosine(34) deaminase TadA [Myxococcales bacterium]
MGVALVLARRAGARGEVPVGAVVVHGDRVIGRGYNLREADADPTAHAEIIALREAAAAIGHWRVLDATLYATLEPCAMCAGALVNARVGRLVYGCPDPKAGAVDSLYGIATDPRLNHRVEVVRGVRADECAEVLRAFFRARRRKSERQTRTWRGGRVVEGA